MQVVGPSGQTQPRWWSIKTFTCLVTSSLHTAEPPGDQQQHTSMASQDTHEPLSANLFVVIFDW
jgi:hypothetical protein